MQYFSRRKPCICRGGYLSYSVESWLIWYKIEIHLQLHVQAAAGPRAHPPHCGRSGGWHSLRARLWLWGALPGQHGEEATASTEPWPLRAASAEALVLGPHLSSGHGLEILLCTPTRWPALPAPSAPRGSPALGSCRPWLFPGMQPARLRTFSELLVNPVSEEVFPTWL